MASVCPLGSREQLSGRLRSLGAAIAQLRLHLIRVGAGGCTGGGSSSGLETQRGRDRLHRLSSRVLAAVRSAGEAARNSSGQDATSSAAALAQAARLAAIFQARAARLVDRYDAAASATASAASPDMRSLRSSVCSSTGSGLRSRTPDKQAAMAAAAAAAPVGASACASDLWAHARDAGRLAAELGTVAGCVDTEAVVCADADAEAFFATTRIDGDGNGDDNIADGGGVGDYGEPSSTAEASSPSAGDGVDTAERSGRNGGFDAGGGGVRKQPGTAAASASSAGPARFSFCLLCK